MPWMATETEIGFVQIGRCFALLQEKLDLVHIVNFAHAAQKHHFLFDCVFLIRAQPKLTKQRGS